MALIGLVRVSTDAQDTRRQHDVPDPIYWRVFEEKVSGKLAVEDRPGLVAALAELREGDMLAVVEVARLSRNLLEGLIMLQELFARGARVKVLEGIAAGEHTERSFLLDMALALAEDRRRDISRKTRDGLAAAARRGRKGGRPFRHHRRPAGTGSADARGRHERPPYRRSPRHFQRLRPPSPRTSSTG